MFLIHGFKRYTNLITAIALFLLSISVNAATSGAQHGFAMHGKPQYPENFTHFKYANPDAPVKGKLRMAVVGDNFDSFNPFLVKGVPAAGINAFQYDSLMKKAGDEAFTLYGLIAKTIEVPDDRSWVEFTLHPNAVFHDGHPIEAEDVEFTFKTLTTNEKVEPFFRAYYADVDKIVIKDKKTIRFVFKTDQNKELPLILAELPVLPKHYFEKNEFDNANLNIPLGSGPYKIKSFDPGRSITWERVDNYWAADLPVNKGFHNFKEINYEYYKDNTIALEAFKAGEYDFRQENTARNWANAYVGPKFDNGELVKEEIKHDMPAGMQGFVMNARRPVFSDRKVREALSYAFDFEWTNANLFNDQYKRTNSYFQNSELAAKGLPSKEELALLTPFKDLLPEEVFSKEYKAPTTEPPSSIRNNLRSAVELLRKAGWTIQNGQLVSKSTSQPLTFEIMIVSKDFERILLPFIKNLEKLGIKVTIRKVDSSQYISRIQSQDFDMIVYTYGQSLSPGNEQRAFWHSDNANKPGTRNLSGIKNPAVDALIDKVITAQDREELVISTRALDRVLLWGHYVIPNWHNPNLRVSYKSTLQHPSLKPKSGMDISTWWFK